VRRAGDVVGLEQRGPCGYCVRAAYPHDPCAFTQGLVWDDGALFESTGLLGRSSLRRVELGSGRVLRLHRLPEHVFAEGITVVGERLVQLTWRTGLGFVYAKATLEPIGEFALEGEGWGLATDDGRLVMSDGSATLRFLDPRTFATVGTLPVHDGGRPVVCLNDLQVVGNVVWANVWRTPRLARISLASGAVEAWLDLAPLCRLAENRGRGNVLNGVAYETTSGRLLVTGKRWPRIFALELLT